MEDHPMPGQTNFTAEEEKAMRERARVAPAATPEKIMRDMVQASVADGPLANAPDDATDEQ